ncbi:MAG TPA: GntR family transcriptional regulator [Kiritimatiellia bacterium]|nr:GntR family transcriptional regulator [Kiritimatiellia bacterium]
MANYSFPEEGGRVEPNGAKTLTRKIYEALRSDILTGRRKPGDRLVRKTVAREMGVSPMPITEALYMLELDGLVENVPMYGCRVRPMTEEDIHNDQILREAIECQTARLCAERATEAELSRLAAAAVRVDRLMAEGDPQSVVGMNLHCDFHLEIARNARCAILVEALERVWFRRNMRLNWINATACKPVPYDWHQKLVAVLKKRDPDAATAAMRDHTRWGLEKEHQALELIQKQLALESVV